MALLQRQDRQGAAPSQAEGQPAVSIHDNDDPLQASVGCSEGLARHEAHMHRVNLAPAVLATGVLVLGLSLPAEAGAPGNADARCNPLAGVCDVTVERY